MNKISMSLISVLLIVSLGACNKTTKVEKEVIIHPDSTVTDSTKIEKEITTEINVDGVEVKTNSN